MTVIGHEQHFAARAGGPAKLAPTIIIVPSASLVKPRGRTWDKTAEDTESAEV